MFDPVKASGGGWKIVRAHCGVLLCYRNPLGAQVILWRPLRYLGGGSLGSWMAREDPAGVLVVTAYIILATHTPILATHNIILATQRCILATESVDFGHVFIGFQGGWPKSLATVHFILATH